MDKNRVLIDLSESERTDSGRVDFALQRPEQRVFSAIRALQSEVNNGGFTQYFASHDGDSANFAPSALREIGAHRCAAIVEKALRLAAPNGELPDSHAGRESLIASLPLDVIEQLDATDKEFFSYPDDLTELLFEYVSKRPFMFGRI